MAFPPSLRSIRWLLLRTINDKLNFPRPRPPKGQGESNKLQPDKQVKGSSEAKDI